MRAKISYSVDIDSVPHEVNRIISPEISKLEDAIKDVSFNITRSNIDIAIFKIEKLRRIMLDVDTRAEECHSILQGYKKAIESQSSSQEESNESLPK